MKKTHFKLLGLFDMLAFLLFVATFSPLIIPRDEIEPSILGIPYTMWMGFIVSLLFVVLTYLVSLTIKKENNVK